MYSRLFIELKIACELCPITTYFPYFINPYMAHFQYTAAAVTSKVDQLKVDASLLHEPLHHQVVSLLDGQEKCVAAIDVEASIHVHALLHTLLGLVMLSLFVFLDVHVTFRSLK